MVPTIFSFCTFSNMVQYILFRDETPDHHKVECLLCLLSFPMVLEYPEVLMPLTRTLPQGSL